MSLSNLNMPEVANANGSHVAATPRPLHRVGAVRRQQGISRRSVGRRLNIDTTEVKAQERETSDMSLSRLYEWQQVLDVPVGELLVESTDPLSAPVLKRAQLLRTMKTALALLEVTERLPVQRLVQTLVDQLVEIMPELKGVGPWHAVGQRRRRDELGRAADRRLSEDVFMDLMD